ncbi:MAG: response regulator [Deltaproteobacteria bacterium]|jgi:two-component system chemotaxis response regulator CheY
MAFNILIADDSETMRAAIKKVVSMSGVPVGDFYEAANGKEALSVVENAWVDVILSDINMPQMNGIELLEEIKKSDVHANLPVIFITTESSEARVEEAKRIGASGYIKKPFLPETIKQILCDVLEKAYDQRLSEERAARSQDETEEGMDF